MKAMARALFYFSIFFIVNVHFVLLFPREKNTEELDNLAVENLRDYLKIESVHPNVNYSKLKLFF